MKAKVLFQSLVFVLFATVSYSQDDQIEIYNREAINLKEEYDEIQDLKFVGGGDFNTISQNEQNLNSANLSVGFYYRRNFRKDATKLLRNIELDVGFNIASTSDTIVHVPGGRDFGNFILNPINQKQSARLDMYSFFKRPDSGFLKHVNNVVEGVFLRFYGSSNYLESADLSTNFTALHLKFGFFQEFMPNQLAQKENLSLMLGFAYTLRSIKGDIIQNDAADLIAITGSSKRNFNGLDMVFSAKLNDFRVEFIVPFIASGDTEIPGLTNTQFITQFRFIGGFNIGTARRVAP